MHKLILPVLLLLPFSSFASDTYNAYLTSAHSESVTSKHLTVDGTPVSSSERFLVLKECVNGAYTWKIDDNYDTALHLKSSLKSSKNKIVYNFTIRYNDIDCENLTLHKNILSKEVTFDKDSGYIGFYQVGNKNFKLVLEKQ